MILSSTLRDYIRVQFPGQGKMSPSSVWMVMSCGTCSRLEFFKCDEVNLRMECMIVEDVGKRVDGFRNGLRGNLTDITLCQDTANLADMKMWPQQVNRQIVVHGHVRFWRCSAACPKFFDMTITLYFRPSLLIIPWNQFLYMTNQHIGTFLATVWCHEGKYQRIKLKDNEVDCSLIELDNLPGNVCLCLLKQL